MHEAGMGLADADIICSAMNLPLTFGFWSTQGNFVGVVEEKIGKAEVAATALAMKEVCQQEIYQTLNVHERGDLIFSGGTVLLLRNACLYSICHNSPLITLWAGSSDPAGRSTILV